MVVSPTVVCLGVNSFVGGEGSDQKSYVKGIRGRRGSRSRQHRSGGGGGGGVSLKTDQTKPHQSPLRSSLLPLSLLHLHCRLPRAHPFMRHDIRRQGRERRGRGNELCGVRKSLRMGGQGHSTLIYTSTHSQYSNAVFVIKLIP